MADPNLRRAEHLAALARLQPGLAHSARSDLGNVALQVHLLGELLERSKALDGEERARLAAPLARTRTGLDRVERWVNAVLAALAPGEAEADGCDLGVLLGELGPLLSAGFHERRIEWRAAPVAPGLRVGVGRETVRAAITIAAAGMMESAPAMGGRIEACAERQGNEVQLSLAGAGVRADAGWVKVVSDTLAEAHCRVIAEPEQDRVVMRFPGAH
jgi:hypothetical protein